MGEGVIQARPSAAPSCPMSEAALIGACIIDYHVIDDVLPILSASDFYGQRHGEVFEAIVRCHERGRGGDTVALIRELGGDPDGDIERLASGCPSTVGAYQWARTVRDKARLRNLISACEQAAWLARGCDDDADATIAKCEQMIYDAAATVNTEAVEPLSVPFEKELARMEAIEAGNYTESRIPSAWPGVNQYLSGGLEAGELCVAGGRPAMGKSAFGVGWAQAAARAGCPVLFVSLEMSNRAIARRFLALSTNIDISTLKVGRLGEHRLGEVCAFRGSPELETVYLLDAAGYTIEHVAATARRMIRRKGVGLIVIDYLQLCSSNTRKWQNAYEESSHVSKQAKTIARRMNVAVLALAQLNRGNTKRDTKRPQMSDLRETGQIEQDADSIILLHREGYYHQGDAEWNSRNDPNEVELIIAKQRDGATGIVRAHWDGPHARFASIAS